MDCSKHYPKSPTSKWNKKAHDITGSTDQNRTICNKEELKPYFIIKYELTIYDGIIVLGDSQILVPITLVESNQCLETKKPLRHVKNRTINFKQSLAKSIDDLDEN